MHTLSGIMGNDQSTLRPIQLKDLGMIISHIQFEVWQRLEPYAKNAPAFDRPR